MSKQQLDNLIFMFLPLRGLLFPENVEIRLSLGFMIPIKEENAVLVTGVWLHHSWWNIKHSTILT